MTIENKLEDSELLKQKMQEGYQCVLQGRSVYQLKSNKEGIVSAVPWSQLLTRQASELVTKY